MTQDNGMDASPSWQELKDERDALERQLASRDTEITQLSNPLRRELHNPDGLTYRPPSGGWVCFHCGDRLLTEHEARAHFGGDPQATPTCQELALEVESYKLAAQAASQLLEAARRECDALAAYGARLRGLGQLVREAATDLAHIGTEELFDRAEKWDAALEETPATSLDRRDAEKQAEVLDKLRRGLLRNSSAFVLKTLEVEASKLRRQAEGGE